MYEVERGDLCAPAWVVDVDLASPYGGDAVVDVDRYATAWCLVRADNVAVGARFLDIRNESTIRMADLRDLFADSDIPRNTQPPAQSGESLTVVIPTNRITTLPRTLASLASQTDDDFDVLIVDNSADASIVNSLTDVPGLHIRLCHEPTPGVTHARNRGITELTSDLVAWIDDDEVADPDWIKWIKRGFASPGQPDAVAGVMLPAELETPAQVDFERYGGFNKGRPMQPVELRAGGPAVRDPFYPLPNFGAGGNLAFRTEALRSIGGFRHPLGTPSIGGEDTWVLALLLESGSMVLHWPPAVTWHYHRRTHAELERQFFSYAAGLTAFYAAIITTSPKHWRRIAKLTPDGLRQFLSNRKSEESARPPDNFPPELLQAVRQGLLVGPWLYIREMWRQRHLHAPRVVPPNVRHDSLESVSAQGAGKFNE